MVRFRVTVEADDYSLGKIDNDIYQRNENQVGYGNLVDDGRYIYANITCVPWVCQQNAEG